jgi:cytoskeletal protein CcmA (bactofilin family)
VGPTELLIEGEVEGEIRVEASVMIGNDGVVQGPVTAQVVRVSGRVLGSIQAVERIEVAPSGSVEGDMAAPRVIIAEGAFFKGRVEMKGERAEKERERDRDRERQRERGNEPRRPKNGDTGNSQRTPSEPGS